MAHTRRAWRMLALMSITSGLLSFGAGCAENIPDTYKARKANEATIQVFRDHTSHNVYSTWSMRVHINGYEVGSIKDGETKEFNYVPKDGGTNTVKMVMDFENGRFWKESDFAGDVGSFTCIEACLGWTGWDLTCKPPLNIDPDFQRDVKANSRMLTPGWYKSAYFIYLWKDTALHCNRLHIHLLLLGLIVYPLLWCPIACVCNLADANEGERGGVNLGLGLFLSGLGYGWCPSAIEQLYSFP
jgi:hypothetical protein